MLLSPVYAVTHVHARHGCQTQLHKLLAELIEPSQSEPGCLSFTVLQSGANPTEFALISTWKDEDSLTCHLDSAHVQEAMLEGMDWMQAPPETQRYHAIAPAPDSKGS